MLAAALISVRLLVGHAARWIGRLDAGRHVALAWIAAAIPGIVFLILTPLMLHTWNPRMIGSAECAAHCYGLALLVIGTTGIAAWCSWAQCKAARNLLRLAAEPSERLGRMAGELGILARELSTESPLIAVAGFLRPCVLVSLGALEQLDDIELRAALAHEAAHLRRRETLRTAAAEFLSRCTPLPAREAFAEYAVAREIAADRDAARQVGRAILARALVKFARATMATPAMVQFAERKNVRARVELLLGEESGRSAGLRGYAVVCALLATAALAGATPLILTVVRAGLCLGH